MSINSNALETRKIYVDNVNIETSAMMLANAFEKFGEIRDVRIKTYRLNGRTYSKGKAIIEFKNEESVENALKSEEIIVEDHILSVKRVCRPVQKKHDTALVARVPQGMSENDLLNEFKKYNAINARILYKDKQGLRGCYGYIKFDSNLNRNLAVEEMQMFLLKGEKSRLTISRVDFDEMF